MMEFKHSKSMYWIRLVLCHCIMVKGHVQFSTFRNSVIFSNLALFALPTYLYSLNHVKRDSSLNLSLTRIVKLFG